MLSCLQIAPIYLISCMKQGLGLLEILLYKQPVQHNEMLLKVFLFNRCVGFYLFFSLLLHIMCFPGFFVADKLNIVACPAEYRDMPLI